MRSNHTLVIMASMVRAWSCCLRVLMSVSSSAFASSASSALCFSISCRCRSSAVGRRMESFLSTTAKAKPETGSVLASFIVESPCLIADDESLLDAARVGYAGGEADVAVALGEVGGERPDLAPDGEALIAPAQKAHFLLAFRESDADEHRSALIDSGVQFVERHGAARLDGAARLARGLRSRQRRGAHFRPHGLASANCA